MNTTSQTAKILKWMLSGHSITALQALRKFRCFRLASRILELRQSYKIKVEFVTTKGGARVARYSIGI